MKKILIILFALLLIAGISNAQSKTAIGVNAGADIGLGHFGTAWGTGYGGNGTFMYTVAKNLDFTGTVGYHTWSNNNHGWHTFPVFLGVRYTMGNGNVLPYLAFKAGLHFYTVDTNVSNYGSSSSSTNHCFGMLGGLGVIIPAGKSLDIDITGNYNFIATSGSTSSYIGIYGGILVPLK